ncbi:hypothetical protein I3842_14G097100 [Carya illinoinensis]|uniref:Uncharacterized protein n=1 Tax=Carya illinoinensis TaxID=32201 RepID=A0A922ACA7_CARIL|nr:hypothetical protein I3842_14G097100 [Carya illinoinensis]
MSLQAYASTPSPTQLSQPPKGPKPAPLPDPTQPSFSNTNHRVSLKQSNKPIDPTVWWTSSIARRCRNGQLAEAAAEFSRMRLAGFEPNHITFLTLLSGCVDFPAGSVSFGASIHGYVRKLGLDTNHVMVGTALVNMYAKCGRVDLARLAFDEMVVKNSISWNTMVNGYMRNGQIEDAIQLFDQMPKRDAVSWTALIGGFVKEERFEEALVWFREMLLSGVEPDYVTIIAVLSACANLGTLTLGFWMNRFVMKQEFRYNIRINNSFIDMYSRCGCIEFARQVFEKMQWRTVVSWNSIIVALTACSHAGLVGEGLQFFADMKIVHGITPRIEHYGCIVDLYSRAGRLEDALNVIENMPMKPNEVVLGSLLAACSTQGNVDLAERLSDYLLEFDPGGDSNYVLLANIYAAVGKWSGAGIIRRKMKARGIQKKPGFSSVEIGCSIHEFVAGDKSHAETDCLYSMLELLSLELKLCGYVPETIEKESYEDD